ncbi:tRNA(His) guanylyltransferase Thg1 family protein [Methanobrevibacter sp. 87.7]|uniref:tRNA(His) guanylyltransferase Thg1 family protein n=1 Tax=Methanobrevibacter sp. 87.7 TaxID=387957 RepID=UPI001E5441BB|nr:tRNA(His) guanylyltransferase Thg1 family protein [Methanobrevibacter sp. 87.7]
MSNNSMKDFEIYSNLKVSQANKIIIRLDGRNFHSLSSDLNFNKPYDSSFAKAMSDVCTDIMKEFSPAFIYSFSDEINILLNDIPFNGRVEKLDSVFASFASGSLTSRLLNEFPIDNEKLFNKEEYEEEYERFKKVLGVSTKENNDSLTFRKPISFDSRIIPLSDDEISDYFKWRQDESWRNCINGYGIWSLKRKYPADVAASKLFGLDMSDIKDLLAEEGINFDEIDTWQKRGFAVYKNIHHVKQYNKKIDAEELVVKKYLYRDFNLPKFDRKFFVEKELIGN